MAITLLVEMPGVTAEQYDAFHRDLDVEQNPPAGFVLHVSGATDDGIWRIVDVWESQEASDTFVRERVIPAMQKHNLPQPRVTVFPVHEGVARGGPIG